MCGISVVYTNPLTNPQRTPNGDSKRIEAIKEANQQYPELGSWNLSLLLSYEFDVHVPTMSFLRILDPVRYKTSEIAEEVIFMKTRPHVMYHADTREVTLGNGSLIYQI